MPTQTRQRRPMIEMTGTVADLCEQDYIDEIGGQGFKRFTIGALVHRITDGVSLSTGEPGRNLDLNGRGVVGLFTCCPVKFRRFTD